MFFISSSTSSLPIAGTVTDQCPTINGEEGGTIPLGFGLRGKWGKVKQGHWEEIGADVGLIRSLQLKYLTVRFTTFEPSVSSLFGERFHLRKSCLCLLTLSGRLFVLVDILRKHATPSVHTCHNYKSYFREKYSNICQFRSLTSVTLF